MHYGRIALLADYIDKLEDVPYASDLKDYGFCMGDYSYDDCGTPSCIAGHALELFYPGKLATALMNSYRVPLGLAAAKVLGIPEDKWVALFEPRGYYSLECVPTEKGYITAKHAANCLRLLSETGEVDWHASQPGRNCNERR